MKQRYKSIKTFIGLLSIVAVKTWAQPLAGSYTINSGGTSSANTFTSYTAFASAINTNGVSGPVVVDVTPGSGPYNEQIMFNQISGASGVNNITINGNNTTLMFSSASSSSLHTIAMNSADYFKFNDLNIQGNGSSYAYAVILYSGADYNTFNRCTFSVSTSGTSSNQIPFVISASGTYYGSNGNSGSYNTIKSCTVTGGYYGITIYGNTSSPTTSGNTIMNSSILDFYQGGIYTYYYLDATTIKNNNIQCPTRTNATTKYGIYFYVNRNTIIEGNTIRNLFGPSLNSNTSTSYGIYCAYNTDSYWNYQVLPSQRPNIVRNNLVADITNAGTAYGIYFYYADGEVYNNTVSMDNTSSTGGSCYGIYTGFSNNYYDGRIYNNIVSITRGGTGTKYGYYDNCSSYGTNSWVDRNDLYVNSASGTNYVGYMCGGVSLANMQSSGQMATGFTVNPTFVNIAAGDYHPTNAVINNTAIAKGLVFDVNGQPRNMTTPDIGALEFLTPQCSNSPSLTSVLGPTYAICPGNTTTLGVSFLQLDAGVTYQWESSTSSQVGPWTPINGATSPYFETPPVNSNIYYSVQVTCSNGNGSLQATSAYVMVAGTTTNNAPYHENFEGVAYNGMLPNCSWSTPSGSVGVSTYASVQNNYRQPRSGTKFMSFAANSSTANPNVQYAYSNGIYLQAGVTYTTGLWYLTEYSGLTNFTDLSIMLSTSQSPAGITTTVASTNGPAVATQYKPLSNTVTVNTSGYYYLTMRATNTPASYYLSVDDIFIEIPCTPLYNSPNIAVSGPSQVCLGNPVSLTASGADTYSWTLTGTSFSSNNSGISNTPTQPGVANYVVSGTKALTGCSTSVAKPVNVLAGPLVSTFSDDQDNNVCPGVVTVLHAVGTAVSYTWNVNNGSAGASATVMPSAPTVYSVTGSNSTGCLTTATIALGLETPPTVGGIPSRSVICVGENVNLTGSGADTYMWVSSSAVLIGNPVIASPATPTNFTLTGTSANTGCSNTAIVSVIVSACTGIESISASAAGVNVYPNPSNGVFTIDVNNTNEKTINITDLSGRVLVSSTTTDSSVKFNLSDLSNGVYLVKVQSNSQVSVVRIVKQ